MAESFKSRLFRWRFNLFPAYRRSGGRIVYIAQDFREVRVKIPLTWKTRNYVGTIYGGTMYSAVDPIYMLMLIHNLGPGYVVWDKAAKISFKKPGRDALFAFFALSFVEIDEVKSLAENHHSIDRVYHVELQDREGTVHALVEKTVYISKKRRNKNVE